MQVLVTAVGPDNIGLADPIVHYVTSVGANISEIQMYDHDTEAVFAMLLRMNWPSTTVPVSELRSHMEQVAQKTGLQIRTWSRQESKTQPRLAICTTYRQEPPRAVLTAIRQGQIKASPVLMLGNRRTCEEVAKEFGVDWYMVGDEGGVPDNDRMVELFDQYQVDYILLARYMRILPPSTCWKYAGGRIINLHHGLLPSFPGARPYHDAYGHRMLTYGATIHFIVPELDAGAQIIHQGTFTVAPGTSLDEVIAHGQA